MQISNISALLLHITRPNGTLNLILVHFIDDIYTYLVCEWHCGENCDFNIVWKV